MATGNGAGSPVGGQEVLRISWSQPMGRLQGMGAPNGAGPRAGGVGSPTQSVVAAKGALVGDGSTNGACSPARGTGSPVHSVLAIKRVPAGAGSPERCGPGGRGDGDSSLVGGRGQEGTCGGCKPPMVRDHLLGGLRVVRMRWSQPIYGAPARDGSLEWCWPMGRGGGFSN